MSTIAVTLTVVLDVDMDGDDDLETVAFHALSEYVAENGMPAPTSVQVI